MSLAKFKKYFFWAVILLAAALFVAVPFSASDLRIKIYMEEPPADGYYLYYSTYEQPDFSQEQLIKGEICGEQLVEFVLPKEAHKSLYQVRLDLPENTEPVIISRFDFCSGGFVVKSIPAIRVFSDVYVNSVNQIAAANPILEKYYIQPDGMDPYFVFTPDFGLLCQRCYSHYTLTKLFLCLAVAVFLWNPWKHIFEKNSEERL